MSPPKATEMPDRSLARELLYAARYYLGNRRAILILATITIVAGIAFNWNWLVVTGLAPILLAALPCLVMCGLGLCMHRLFGNSCESQPSQKSESTARPLAASTTDGSSASVSTCCSEQNSAGTPADLNKIESLEERRKPHA